LGKYNKNKSNKKYDFYLEANEIKSSNGVKLNAKGEKFLEEAIRVMPKPIVLIIDGLDKVS
jgi:hypothetical protein